MTAEALSTLTWQQLIEHLEQLWGKPAAEFMPELLPYLRHEIIASLEPVLVGAKVLTSLYTLPAAPRAWLGDCIQGADEWLWGCQQISDVCIAEKASQADQCQCFLSKIGPLFANCAGLLAACPTAVLANIDDPEVNQILSAVNRGLSHLAAIAAGLARGDLAWLRAMLDENERKKKPRTPNER